MDILGHPIVPGDIIDIYFEHFKTLPWIKFVPTLDILHSLLKCVRNNRKNINFVIFVMTQVRFGLNVFYDSASCSTCAHFLSLMKFESGGVVCPLASRLFCIRQIR